MGRPRKVVLEEENFDCYPEPREEAENSVVPELNTEQARRVTVDLEYVNIRLPLAPLRDGVHIPQQVNLKMRGPMAKTFRRVLDGLLEEGCVSPRGGKVCMSAADVFAHILFQIQSNASLK